MQPFEKLTVDRLADAISFALLPSTETRAKDLGMEKYMYNDNLMPDFMANDFFPPLYEHNTDVWYLQVRKWQRKRAPRTQRELSTCDYPCMRYVMTLCHVLKHTYLVSSAMQS